MRIALIIAFAHGSSTPLLLAGGEPHVINKTFKAAVAAIGNQPCAFGALQLWESNQGEKKTKRFARPAEGEVPAFQLEFPGAEDHRRQLEEFDEALNLAVQRAKDLEIGISERLAEITQLKSQLAESQDDFRTTAQFLGAIAEAVGLTDGDPPDILAAVQALKARNAALEQMDIPASAVAKTEFATPTPQPAEKLPGGSPDSPGSEVGDDVESDGDEPTLGPPPTDSPPSRRRR